MSTTSMLHLAFALQKSLPWSIEVESLLSIVMGLLSVFRFFCLIWFKIHDFNWRTRGKLKQILLPKRFLDAKPVNLCPFQPLKRDRNPPNTKAVSLQRPDGFPICSVKFTQPCGHPNWEMVQRNAALNVAVGCYHRNGLNMTKLL